MSKVFYIPPHLRKGYRKSRPAKIVTPKPPKLPRPKKPPPTRAELREKRLIKARAQLAAWQTKAKLASTKIRKYRLRVARLEKPAPIHYRPCLRTNAADFILENRDG